MHKDFIEKHAEHQINYTTYMHRLNNLNISFAKLGEEECEVCSVLQSEDKHEYVDKVCQKSNCESCLQLAHHLKLAGEARDAYKLDGDAIIEGRIVRSVDLQKVVMLPRMPGIKAACFTRRLVTFHHTFAPVRSYCQPYRVYSVLWHEAISGKKAEDITSAVVSAIQRDRDI